MFKEMKHIGKVMVIVVLTLVLLLTACSNSSRNASGSDDSPTSSNGAQTEGSETADPYDKLPKTVSISTLDRGQVSSDEGTYEKNRWVDWIRKESGIDVTIVPVPRSQSQDTLNVLIASHQAPDLIWEFDRSYFGKLVTQGVIQPIDEYIEKYSTSYKAYLAENPELLPHLTFNGEIYAVSVKRTISTIANHAIWIRQDWLDELNLQAPRTTDELIEVALAFKKAYPDSTPIVGGNMGDVITALFGAVHSLWYLEDGKMQFGPNMDQFAAALSYQKKLYELGLIDKEYLTDSNSQRSNQAWTTGKAGILFQQWSNDPITRDLLANIPNAKPVPMEAPASPYGQYAPFQESIPHIFVAFNKDMKNPKAAMEYLDWIFETGWHSLVYGEEGVHHEIVNGVAKKLDADKFTKEVAYANEYAVLRQEVVEPGDLIIKAASDEISQRLAALNAKSLENALKHEFRRDFPYQPVFDEMNEIRSTLDTFVSETRAQAVMQGANYDGEWAVKEIRKEWERLGGLKAEEIAQKWYEDNKSDF